MENYKLFKLVRAIKVNNKEENAIINSNLVPTYTNTSSQDFHVLKTMITKIPNINISNWTSCNRLFNYCSNLIEIPYLDTNNVTNMGYMFDNCISLIEIPNLDTSNVNYMGYMFNNCASLTKIPNLDTSNVTNMQFMFYGCKTLQSIPELDTSNVTNMANMFNGCTNLQTIPNLDTSNVTNMYYMFRSCTNLQTIPSLDTSNVTNVGTLFGYCSNLIKIGELNGDNINNLNHDTFGNCFNLTDFNGFKNLGKVFVRTTTNYSGYVVNLSNSTKLTHESLINIFNNLYDLNLSYDVANGGTLYTQRLSLGATNMAKLTAEEIAIATNKGWNVS